MSALYALATVPPYTGSMLGSHAAFLEVSRPSTSGLERAELTRAGLPLNRELSSCYTYR